MRSFGSGPPLLLVLSLVGCLVLWPFQPHDSPLEAQLLHVTPSITGGRTPAAAGRLGGKGHPEDTMRPDKVLNTKGAPAAARAPSDRTLSFDATARPPTDGPGPSAVDCDVWESVAALGPTDTHCRRSYTEADHIVIGRWNPWPTPANPGPDPHPDHEADHDLHNDRDRDIDRDVDPGADRDTDPSDQDPDPGHTCANWTVVTLAEGELMPTLCDMTRHGWCVVLVALDQPAPTPPPVPLPPHCHYLRLGARGAAALPATSPARKMLGYAFALRRGARLILDASAANARALARAAAPLPVWGEHDAAASSHDTTRPFLNPSARDFFPKNCSTNTFRWAMRRTGDCLVFLRHGSPHTALSVQQLMPSPPAAPDHDLPPPRDPTRQAPPAPTHSLPVFPPHGTLVPLNGNSTVFWRRAFWALWLPVHASSPAAAEVLRGYLLQRLMWEVGGRVLFVPGARLAPHHRHLEADPELRAARIIRGWQPQRRAATLCEKAAELVAELVARSVLHQANILSLQWWCTLLERLGLAEPPPPPAAPSALGAVVTMSPGNSRLKAYIKSWRRLTWVTKYPVLIFCDRDKLTVQWEEEIRKAAGPLKLFFYTVDYNLNEDLVYGFETQVWVAVLRVAVLSVLANTADIYAQ